MSTRVAWACRVTFDMASRNVATTCCSASGPIAVSTGPSKRSLVITPECSASWEVSARSVARMPPLWRTDDPSANTAERMSRMIVSSMSTACCTRSAALTSIIRWTVAWSDIPVAKSCWMTVSWRSRAIRSWSSTTASRSSSRRARPYSRATLTWDAKLSSSQKSVWDRGALPSFPQLLPREASVSYPSGRTAGEVRVDAADLG